VSISAIGLLFLSERLFQEGTSNHFLIYRGLRLLGVAIAFRSFQYSLFWGVVAVVLLAIFIWSEKFYRPALKGLLIPLLVLGGIVTVIGLTLSGLINENVFIHGLVIGKVWGHHRYYGVIAIFLVLVPIISPWRKSIVLCGVAIAAIFLTRVYTFSSDKTPFYMAYDPSILGGIRQLLLTLEIGSLGFLFAIALKRTFVSKVFNLPPFSLFACFAILIGLTEASNPFQITASGFVFEFYTLLEWAFRMSSIVVLAALLSNIEWLRLNRFIISFGKNALFVFVIHYLVLDILFKGYQMVDPLRASPIKNTVAAVLCGGILIGVMQLLTFTRSKATSVDKYIRRNLGL